MEKPVRNVKMILTNGVMFPQKFIKEMIGRMLMMQPKERFWINMSREIQDIALKTMNHFIEGYYDKMHTIRFMV